MDASKHLLLAAKYLSNSSTPFPVPNRHLPPELLHHIYDFVSAQTDFPLLGSDDEDLASRQKTILALSLTSKLWRRIVLERPVDYLKTEKSVERYSQRPGARLLQPQELFIDLTEDRFRKYEYSRDWQQLFTKLGDHLRQMSGFDRAKGKLILILNSYVNKSLANDGWATSVQDFASKWKRSSLWIPQLSEGNYGDLWAVLERRRKDTPSEKEYYIGRSDEPTLLLAYNSEEIADGFDLSEGFSDLQSVMSSIYYLPTFVNYTVFAAPWLVVRSPTFLVEIEELNHGRPQTLPPSCLRHLEITYEACPANHTYLEDLEYFFSAFAPTIERLTFRLRAAAIHRHRRAELELTQQLITSLASCHLLRHLEIGGFGFSPDFLDRLTILPLTTLVIFPTEHHGTARTLLPLLSQPSVLRRSLKTLHSAMVSMDGSEHAEAMQTVFAACRDLNINFRWEHCSEEWVLLETLLEMSSNL